MSEEHDELLSEYLDGRLDAESRRRAESLLAADPALARRLRLLQAMRGALRATAEPAPGALRAALYAAAAQRAQRPSWRTLLKEALVPKPWAFGAASAFAAALVVLALRTHRPPAAPPAFAPAASSVESAAPVAAAPQWRAAQAQLAAELWTDDDGGDDDET